MDVIGGQDGRGLDSMLATVSEDRLLLLEQTHRVANEVASALAALHLVRGANGSRIRGGLLGSAIKRLEGFATVNRVLSLTAGRVALDAEIERLCKGLGAARRDAVGSRISLDLSPVVVDAMTARRVLMIAAELAFNAIRHGLGGRGGELVVVLRRDDDEIVFSVMDDGPGLHAGGAAGGTGMGGPIVRELVRRAGGSMDYDTGPNGTAFHVLIPVMAVDGAF